ncbi:MAG: hypothetical protein N4A49_15000 [Marinifilaceae bacterium]|jgi:hypothetical protein|nr:hypothetical protein [Marinifilaceae bacterium]
MRYIILCFLIFITNLTNAQDLQKHISLDRDYNEFKTNNPISKYFNALSAFSETSISYKTSKQKGYYDTATGDDLNQIDYNISGELTKNKMLIYGSLAYSNQTRDNIKWNLMDNNHMFCSYSLVDSTIYKQYAEDYVLNGAFAKEYDKYLIGISANTLSRTSYGKIDPRPKNDIFDYDISVYLARKLNNKFLINFSLTHNDYSLQNQIRVFKEDIYDSFIVSKPFGFTDKMVSDKSRNFSLVLDGGGRDIALNIENFKPSGFEFYAKYSSRRYKLDFTGRGHHHEAYKYNKSQLSVLYKFDNYLISKIQAKYLRDKKNVKEKLLGGEIGLDMFLDKYFQETNSFNISALCRKDYDKSFIEFSPEFNYDNIKIDYEKPSYYHYIDNINMKFKFNYFKKIKNNSLNAYLGLNLRNNIKNDLKSTKNKDFVNQKFYAEKIEIGHLLMYDDYYAIESRISYDYSLNDKHSVFLAAAYNYFKAEANRKVNEVQINLGFRF